MPYLGRIPTNSPLVVDGIENLIEYTATAGQTAFTATYFIGAVKVYLNGVLLADSDYIATNGTSINLVAGANVDDSVYIQSFGNFELADTHTKGAADSRFLSTLVDGAKLDGIEASATADQTKLDIEGLGIAASSITGALPAISGSALTGVGKVLQVQRLISDSFDVSISAAGEYSILSKTITVSAGSKLLIFAESGQIQMTSVTTNNPSIGISVDSTIVINRNHTNHAWYNITRSTDARVFINTTGMTGALTAGSHTIEIIAGIQTAGQAIVYGYQGGGGDRRPNVVVWEIAQ